MPTSSSSSRLLDLLRLVVLSFVAGLVAERLEPASGLLSLLVLLVALAVSAGLTASGLVALRDARRSPGGAGGGAAEDAAARWRVTSGVVGAVAVLAGFALARLAFP